MVLWNRTSNGLRYIFTQISRSSPFRVTWRHRACDCLILQVLFPIGVPLQPRVYLQPYSRYWAQTYWDATFTYHGHVTSSITWLFDSPHAIFYWCSVVFGTEPPCDIRPKMSCAHCGPPPSPHTHTHTPQVILCFVPCNGQAINTSGRQIFPRYVYCRVGLCTPYCRNNDRPVGFLFMHYQVIECDVVHGRTLFILDTAVRRTISTNSRQM